MKYKFVKINLFGKITSWVLEIDNLRTFGEWYRIYQSQDLKKGFDGIENRIVKTINKVFDLHQDVLKDMLSDNYDHKYIKERLKRIEYCGEITSGHWWKNDVAALSEIVMNDDENLFDGFKKVQKEIVDCKIKAILNGDTIYVYPVFQWFTKPKNCEIVEEFKTDDISKYPD